MRIVDRKQTGLNLNNYILKSGLGFYEFAEKIGTNTSMIYKWVHGTNMPQIDGVVKICDFFNIKLTDLIATKEAEI